MPELTDILVHHPDCTAREVGEGLVRGPFDQHYTVGLNHFLFTCFQKNFHPLVGDFDWFGVSH